MTLWLIGMMGAGKTVVGERTAGQLGVDFADTDRLVEETAGMTIARMWTVQGEPGFRRLEAAVIRRIAGAPAVVATGGGAPLDPRNRETMRGSGPVVWLRAETGELADRLQGDNERPLLRGADPVTELDRLIEQRAHAYDEAATHIVDTSGRSVAEVAEEVASLWKW